MVIKGKSLGLSGVIVSIIFSLIGVFGALGYNVVSSEPTFEETFVEQFLAESNGMYTEQDALGILELYENMANIFLIGSIIYLVLGIVALVFILMAKKSNAKGIGIFFIVFSIIHLCGVRMLAFFLILIAGIQLMNNKEEVENNDTIQIEA